MWVCLVFALMTASGMKLINKSNKITVSAEFFNINVVNMHS